MRAASQSRRGSTRSSSSAARALAVSAGGAALGHELLHRLGVVGHFAREEEVPVVEEPLQGVDALLDERQHAQHVVVGEEVPAQAAEELRRRHPAQVLAVEPGQLLRIEDGAAQRDALEGEGGHELVERELLLVVRHRPRP